MAAIWDEDDHFRLRLKYKPLGKPLREVDNADVETRYLYERVTAMKQRIKQLEEENARLKGLLNAEED